MLDPIEKIRFWSGIMRDHAEFFLVALSSREQEFIRIAEYFKSSFSAIHDELKNMRKYNEVKTLPPILPLLMDFIHFKKCAARRLLQCNIELNFPPSFVNHMISEALEFCQELYKIQKNPSPSPIQEIIDLHKVWLPDASGHASAIACGFDPTENELIKRANNYKTNFNNLYLKAIALGQMLERAALKDGSLSHFNHTIQKELADFICFINEIQELREECKALGTLYPLLLNHMTREEQYYIGTIQQFENKL